MAEEHHFLQEQSEAEALENEAIERVRIRLGIGEMYRRMEQEEDIENINPGSANLDLNPQRPIRPPANSRRMRIRRCRNWVFTYNNYDRLPRFVKEQMLWLRYGEEIGAECHTPHLQGVIQFKNPIEKPSAMYPWASLCHWERMKGSITSNINYTGKDATLDNGGLHEFGCRPLSNLEARKKGAHARHEQLKQILAWARNNEYDKIEEESPGDFIRMGKRLKEIQYESESKKVRITEGVRHQHYWIHGASGTGKTKSVWDLCSSSLYLKMQNKWWDGYLNHRFVLIDDFEPDWTGKAALKRWADRYPFQAESKGSSNVIRPKHMIITSNYRIDDAGFRPQDVEPLKNRFIECNANQFRIFHDMYLKQ